MTEMSDFCYLRKPRMYRWRIAIGVNATGRLATKCLHNSPQIYQALSNTPQTNNF